MVPSQKVSNKVGVIVNSLMQLTRSGYGLSFIFYLLLTRLGVKITLLFVIRAPPHAEEPDLT